MFIYLELAVSSPLNLTITGLDNNVVNQTRSGTGELDNRFAHWCSQQDSFFLLTNWLLGSEAQWLNGSKDVDLQDIVRLFLLTLPCCSNRKRITL